MHPTHRDLVTLVWLWLIVQGGQNYLLDTLPLAGHVEVLLRSIDLITMARPKALLWQARVVIGGNGSLGGAPQEPKSGDGVGVSVDRGGALIVSGLNLLMNTFGTSSGCPSTFPYLIARGTPNSQYGLCYQKQAYATAGNGPCGSWCASPREWGVVKALWGGKCGSECVPVPKPPADASVGAAFPEAAYLLKGLLSHAASSPMPTASVTVKVTECLGCIPSSFVALCG
jgi:hypothetical protein